MTKISLSPEDTFRIGVDLGREAQEGSVLLLSGDLGTGKTVLARGVAEGLGIREWNGSPTFTILQVYEDGRLPLYHFDVYRIEEPEEMDEVGFFDYLYGDGVVLLEWPERVEELLKGDFLEIRIEKNVEKGFDYREIHINHKTI
ncbi:MAG: tRNA (adenosine(37)-N6)-threonylcarbamoyltransferase complex ATPase subunit type 1 TsaE [Lachnospiraceae bacterium]|nr:tRNA (adenosine(37)-N6)-threonylcarbamoyltransferase complex ATPase subunit type 1 TsaE [Lachnospiraceae bacterium]